MITGRRQLIGLGGALGYAASESEKVLWASSSPTVATGKFIRMGRMGDESVHTERMLGPSVSDTVVR